MPGCHLWKNTFNLRKLQAVFKMGKSDESAEDQRVVKQPAGFQVRGGLGPEQVPEDRFPFGTKLIEHRTSLVHMRVVPS